MLPSRHPRALGPVPPPDPGDDPLPTETVVLFFALLAVAGQLALAAAAVLLVAGPRAGRLASWRDVALAAVRPSALTLAAVVATVATLGSLYLSEVAGFTPCRLCWYQRAAMYPLVPLTLLALGRARLRPLVAGIAALGAAVSAYHIALERVPGLETGACDPDNPCTLVYVERFGYLTIPGMALTAFALIALFALVASTRRAAPTHLVRTTS